MKVGVFTIIYNIPTDVFLLQIEAIRKFCKDDDYAIEVIDNSSDATISEGIQYHSNVLGLNYTKTNASSLNGSDSHAFAATTSYRLFKDYFGCFFYIDHDCFPIKDFSVVEILGDKYIAGIGQNERYKYMWPGCVMFKYFHDIDFNPDHALGLDTGGGLRKVIEYWGEENCIFFNESYNQNPHYNGAYNHYALINNGMFLHCINGSGWNHVEGNTDRLNSLINIIREKVNAKVGNFL